MIEINCLYCGCSFTTYNYLKDKQKYCSRKCFFLDSKIRFSGKGNPFYGKKHTEKTKLAISKANKGNITWNTGKKWPEMRGNNNPMRRPDVLAKFIGKSNLTEDGRQRLSESKKGNNNPAKRKEVREKISKTLIGRPQPWNSGEKCHFWKGGLSKQNDVIKSSLAFNQFRRIVYLRDNYKCRKCNKEGGKLNVHHIKNFASHPQLRTIPINGITLCLHCHRKFHNKYGNKDNTVSQIKYFINN
jgi:hypothetical protein